jgi:solute carrier family 25 (mitochondrial folate transporter), member 32
VNHALRLIYQNEGFRGLYKGFYISLLCQASSMSFFFWHYETRKDHLQREGWQVMEAVTRASIEASLLTTMLTQPIWVLKTRMLLNVNRGVGEMENFRHQVRQISAECGPRGFLRGLELSLLLSFAGVIQMYVYEGTKLLYGRLGIPESAAGEKHFLCGSVSKLFSGLLAYPITTLRTRIQQSQVVSPTCTQKYHGLQDLAATTWREEGLCGFYKGFSANLMRGVTQKGIYFYCYEILKDMLFPRGPALN